MRHPCMKRRHAWSDHVSAARALGAGVVRVNALRALAVLACLGSVQEASAQWLTPPKQPSRIRMPEIMPGQKGSGEETTMPALWGLRADGTPVVIAPDQTPPADVAALLVDPPVAARMDPARGTLVLPDGQRLRGQLNQGKESLTWECRWCPPRPVTTEGIRAIILSGDSAPEATQSDVVALANGDRVEGLVTTMDAEGVHLEKGAERTPITLPWARVRSVSFVGQDTPRAGVRVWVRDGSVLDGRALTWPAADLARLMGAGAEAAASVPRAWLLGAEMAPGAVVPLASMQPTTTAASDGQGMHYQLPAPHVLDGTWALDAAPWEIEGPVKVSFPAPDFDATLVMVAGLAPETRQFGVVELVVRAGGKEAARVRLDPAHPERVVSALVPRVPVEIELLAADGSPVGDVVRLDRPVLLKARP